MSTGGGRIKLVRCKDDADFEKIDVSQWNLDALADFDVKLSDILSEAVNEALALAVDDSLEADFEFGYLDPTPAGFDPMTVSVGLPLGRDDGTYPHWRFSITDLVIRFLESASYPDGTLDPNSVPLVRQMAAGFRSIAEAMETQAGKAADIRAARRAKEKT